MIKEKIPITSLVQSIQLNNRIDRFCKSEFYQSLSEMDKEFYNKYIHECSLAGGIDIAFLITLIVPPLPTCRDCSSTRVGVSSFTVPDRFLKDRQ